MDVKLEDLHHSIDIKDEDDPNFDYQQDSNEESQRNSNNYSEIKTEEEWELQLEELHHSIDIKEEAPIQEYRPEGECNTDEKLDEAMDDLPAHSYDHKMEDMNAELEELHHSIDIKEEDDATLEFQEDCNEGTRWRSSNHSQIKSEEIELKLEDLYHHSINIQEDSSVQRRKTKASAKPHVREIFKCNSGKKACKCEICDYQSAQKGTLTRHLKTHTGEKEFKCEICDYKFSQKGSLKSHLKTHTGEKEFKCEICDYRSAEKRNLIRHLKTHTGRSLKFHLISHLKTHTNI